MRVAIQWLGPAPSVGVITWGAVEAELLEGETTSGTVAPEETAEGDFRDLRAADPEEVCAPPEGADVSRDGEAGATGDGVGEAAGSAEGAEMGDEVAVGEEVGSPEASGVGEDVAAGEAEGVKVGEEVGSAEAAGRGEEVAVGEEAAVGEGIGVAEGVGVGVGVGQLGTIFSHV
jgi:hypothetical protein